MLFTEVIENIHFLFFTEICEEQKMNENMDLDFYLKLKC